MKHDPDVPDSDVTPEYCAKHNWLIGSPKTVAEKLRKVYDDVGGFGVLLVFCFDNVENPEAWHTSMRLLAEEVLPLCGVRRCRAQFPRSVVRCARHGSPGGGGAVRGGKRRQFWGMGLADVRLEGQPLVLSMTVRFTGGGPMNRFLRILPLLIATACAAVPILLASPPPAIAEHSWGDYHWARTSNPFTLKVGNNVNSTWEPYLDRAIMDWSASPVLDLTKLTGQAGKPCRPTSGRIEVCNSKYGNNGWLGIAQIWVSGSVHITQATTKVNDTYFNTATYNTPAWRQLVMCQEIAHDFGLDHQDENFNNTNLGSCMDYTSNPGSNQHPNDHDYQHLVAIYNDHEDSTTTVGSTIAPAPGRSGTAADEGPNNPADFGQPTGRRDGQGRHDLFVKTLPNGQRLFTHVFWTLGGPGRP